MLNASLPLFRLIVPCLLVTGLMLSACGGGGSEDEPPPPAHVRENFELVAASPEATYSEGSEEAQTYSEYNRVRLGMGAGALTQSAKLDTAARAHAKYLADNYPTVGSNEVHGKKSFYAETPTLRAVKAGYAPMKLSEFIGITRGKKATDVDCLASLLSNPYSVSALSEPWRDVGIAHVVLKPAPAEESAAAPMASASQPDTPVDPSLPIKACVLVVAVQQDGYPQLPDANVLKPYPFNGQQQVATVFDGGAAGQQPAPDVRNPMGTPVQVSMHNFGSLTRQEYRVDRFELRESSGRVVPARLIVNYNTAVANNVVFYRDPMGLLAASDVLLLPLSPLKDDTLYTATFVGANASQRFERTWSFTTKAATLEPPQP